MKKIYSSLFICLFTLTSSAQHFGWAKAFGGSSIDEGHSLTLDASDNVYSTGRFEGTVDFDPNSSMFNLTSNGDKDVYIQKLDSMGNFVWAKSIGGALRDDAFSITTGASGNVYVTGRFEGTVDFDPGTSTFSITSNGNRDIFILKLDANGNFIWAKAIGNLSNDRGYGITTDASGNVYATGYFGGTVDFDPGVATSNLTSNGGDDIFILKLDGSGNFIWAKSVGGINNDEAWLVRTDDLGNSYLTGFYQDKVDFDPGIGVFNLTSQGNTDAFLLKLLSNGDFAWAKSISGTSVIRGHSIYVDAAVNLYTTGHFEGTVDFDPGAAVFNLTSNGQSDIFVQKLDANGNFIWAKSMGSTATDQGYSIALDTTGSIYLAGNFEGTVDFDPGTSVFNLTSNGQSDVFIQKLDANGAFLWAKSMGGTLIDTAYAIVYSKSGSIFTIGKFEDTVDFDPGAGSFNLVSNGLSDIFIQKLTSIPLGVKKYTDVKIPSIFPNPIQNFVNIDLGSFQNATIKIFNANGQLIYFKDGLSASNHRIELKAASGIYYVLINSQTDSSHFKMVKM